MATANKLTYLNTTKGYIKDITNYSLPSTKKIDNNTTFRAYKGKIYEGILNTMLDKDSVFNAIPKITTTPSTSLSINNTIHAPMKINLKPSELSQASTPTPDSPQDIHTIKIIVYNLNAFDETKLSQEANYNTYNSETGLWTTNDGSSYLRSIFYNAVGSTSAREITKLIKLKPNTNYTLKLYDFVNNSTITTGNFISYAFFNKNNEFIEQSTANTSLITFTSPNQKIYFI